MSKARLVPISPTVAEIEERRLMCEESFYIFAREEWPEVEPHTPFEDGWHIHVICDHLQALAEGWICMRGPEKGKRLRKLVINMPPRHMKSMLGSVLFPAWVWTKYPGKQFFFSSYSQDLADDHSALCFKLVSSEWYQLRWGRTGNPALDGPNPGVRLRARRVRRFTNDQAGARQASSVLGKTTGVGGDIIATDDPHNLMERESDVKRARVIIWWSKGMATRGNDPRTAVRLVIMQRLHPADLSAYCIKTGYSLLKLPARYEGQKEIGVFNHLDPRTRVGEPLWKKRFTDAELSDLERDLGDDATGQLQQRPDAVGGNMVNIRDFRVYTPRILDALLSRPENVDAWVTVWDFAVKGAPKKKGAKRSWTCGQVWCRRGADAFLIDQIRIQGDFTAQIKAAAQLARRWPQAVPIFFEAKANGPAAETMLKNTVPGIQPVEPHGNKEQRLFAVQPFIAGQNVWIPHHDMNGWIGRREYESEQLQAHEGSWVHEIAHFPQIEEKDQVDCTSMALDYLFLQATDLIDYGDLQDDPFDLTETGRLRQRSRREQALRVRRYLNPNERPPQKFTGPDYAPWEQVWEEDEDEEEG